MNDEHQKTVLAVEDDAETLTLLRLLFRKQGVNFIGLSSAENSLSKIAFLKPDLVLLDVMMPGMNGWEIYQWLQGSPELRHIPVIVLTVRPRAMSEGYGQTFDTAAAYMTKPFRPDVLLAAVDRCLTPSSIP